MDGTTKRQLPPLARVLCCRVTFKCRRRRRRRKVYLKLRQRTERWTPGEEEEEKQGNPETHAHHANGGHHLTA